MNQPSSFVRRAQGVPMVYVLVAVVSALLLGMYIGKSSAVPMPAPAQAQADSPKSGADKFDPTSGTLNECKSENKNLLAALDAAGADTRRFDGSRERDDDRRESSSSGMSSSGRRTSFSGERQATKEPIRRTADVRAWSARVQKLQNRPDFVATGRLNNRESVPVEGLLHVKLVGSSGAAVDETSLAMVLDPGLSEWEHMFRWAPEDEYKVQVVWETLTY